MNRWKQMWTMVWLLIALTAITRADIGDEHLVMGNPSDATADPQNRTNYLMRKVEYVLSYNKHTACPNWVSWHLNEGWIGSADRANDFRPDTSLPNGWLQVKPSDYNNSGFDRGHMCNSKDRTKDATSNSDTFLMTNMVPQSPRNNEQTWEALESYCRVLAVSNELYITCGPAGQGGEGQIGKSKTSAKLVKKKVLEADRNDGTSGTVTVPASTWKVIMVLPGGQVSPTEVTSSTTTIAVIIPNTQEISTDWKQYVASVDDVEHLTGYHFFSNVDPTVAKKIKTEVYHQ